MSSRAACSDRKLADRTGLYEATDAMPVVDRRAIQLPARAARPARQAHLELRFGAIELARPQSKFLRHLPKSLPLAVVDVCEINAGPGAEPLHWRLITSHEIATVDDAWRIVEWYKQRWIIEQFFRVLKTQGLKLEDSQIGTADRLLKLVAIAAKAAVITIQLLQARDGGQQPIRVAFNDNEINALAALNRQLEARSKRLKNPAIRPTASPGQPGSSAALAVGTATRRLNLQAPSPSKMASNTSWPSQQDGASEICACPSVLTGRGSG
ncbi:transposase [Bradyrhizobium sp. 13971]